MNNGFSWFSNYSIDKKWIRRRQGNYGNPFDLYVFAEDAAQTIGHLIDFTRNMWKIE